MSYSKQFGDMWYKFPQYETLLFAEKIWLFSENNGTFESMLDEMNIDYWYDLWDSEGE